MRDLAQFYKLLSDEVRLQILWLLFNHKELCVCDLVEALGITQSKASRHLATLRHAKLVADRRDGAWSYYSVRTPRTELERDQLEFLRARLARHPGAARVLRSLHEWLERKQREALCARGSERSALERARAAAGSTDRPRRHRPRSQQVGR